MTLGTQTTFVERLARIGSNANTIASASDVTKIYLNEGVREFAKRSHGVPGEAYLTISPKFDVDTNYAIRFTIAGSKNSMAATDVLIASTTLSDATPTTVANHIGSNINAMDLLATSSGSIACGWSASTWSFYLDCGATATSITIESPDSRNYIDAVDMIFGTAGTKATSTFSGGFPEDCTIETTLPSGFLEIERVEWDHNEIGPAPFNLFMSPQVAGTPSHYAIKNKKIRLYPVPDEVEHFYIRYKQMPDDLGTDGASDSVSCPLPTECHMAPVYYAAACLLEESHEIDKAIYYQRKFHDMVTDYKIRENNNNPTLFPSGSPTIPVKVTVDET